MTAVVDLGQPAEYISSLLCYEDISIIISNLVDEELKIEVILQVGQSVGQSVADLYYRFVNIIERDSQSSVLFKGLLSHCLKNCTRSVILCLQ